MTWQRASDVLAPRRPTTAKEEEAIQEVWDLADRWMVGGCTLSEIKAATSGKQRTLALMYTQPQTPRRAALKSLTAALLQEDQSLLITQGGIYEWRDLYPCQVDAAHFKVTLPIAMREGEPVYAAQVLRPQEWTPQMTREWWED